MLFIGRIKSILKNILKIRGGQGEQSSSKINIKGFEYSPQEDDHILTFKIGQTLLTLPIMIDDFKSDSKPGDINLGSPSTNIQVTKSGNITISNSTSFIKIGSDGYISIKGKSVVIQNDLTIHGKLTVTGNISSRRDIKASGIIEGISPMISAGQIVATTGVPATSIPVP